MKEVLIYLTDIVKSIFSTSHTVEFTKCFGSNSTALFSGSMSTVQWNGSISNTSTGNLVAAETFGKFNCVASAKLAFGGRRLIKRPIHGITDIIIAYRIHVHHIYPCSHSTPFPPSLPLSLPPTFPPSLPLPLNYPSLPPSLS